MSGVQERTGASNGKAWTFLEGMPGGKATRIVWERGGRVCHLCGKPVRLDEASRDHLVPLSKGGCTCTGNIALAHKSCNTRRGNDETFRMTFGTGAQKRRKGHLLSDHPR